MLSKENISKFIILIFLAIFIFHILAVCFYLYWVVWWLDIIMHVLGGLWIALLAAWFLYFSGKVNINNTSSFSVLIIILGIVALGGVLWEFFEFSFDKIILGKIENFIKLAGPVQLGVSDTMSDLFFDLAGGLLGGLIFLKRIKHEKT